MKLVDLLPLKEESTGAFGATSEELADMYSLKMLQQMRDEVMMDMEQQAEPEGGPIADMYGGQLDGLDKAIAIKKGETKDVPYDVAIGRMSRDEFEKSSKFDRIKEEEGFDNFAFQCADYISVSKIIFLVVFSYESRASTAGMRLS